MSSQWKIDSKIAETVYEQWLATLGPEGKINLNDLQEYFDLARIPQLEIA